MTRAVLLQAPARPSARVATPRLAPVVRPRVSRLRAGLALAACIALGGTAVTHSLLAQAQIELDRYEAELTTATQTRSMLRLQVAELESPNRIVEVARERIGMVEPANVVVVSNTGADDSSIATTSSEAAVALGPT